VRIVRLAPGIVFGSALLLWAPQARAQDHTDDHEFHQHHVGVVAGGMTPLSETSQTSLALGVDYTYRFNERWGAGIGADATFGDHKRAAVFAGGATYNLTPALKIGTGPGIELVEKDQPSGGTKNSSYFVWWIGTGYEFHVGSLSIGPILILDFVGETKTNLTYGITVGTWF
jgi:hypothetical protein